MLVSDREWAAFYEVVKAKARLDLSEYKPSQLHRRVTGMAESKGCASMDAFGKWLMASPLHMEWFLDKLAINVSELFRNPEKWVELEKVVLPELRATKSSLRAWSAGCSIGAEPYSLAMILQSTWPGPHKIVGTDIDTAALRQAREGTYGLNDVRAVPEAYAKRYLTREGDSYRVSSDLKRMIEFRQQNLLREKPTETYDLILCRNVVIYFTDEAKDRLYETFFAALRPGGILFVGSTERIFRSREIGYETVLPFYYRKPQQGTTRWANAS